MQSTINQLPIELVITVSIILGLLIGSFLNVVIHRLPIMLQNAWKSDCCELLEIKQSEEKNNGAPSTYNLLFPSSSCPNCKHKIRSWENIPVISYLFLKGKCSGCKNPISSRYPIIEAVTGILSGLMIYKFGATAEGGLLLILLWSLIALTMIDIDTQLLPDNITLPLLWLGIIANSFEFFTSLEDAVYGAIAGYLSLWSVFWAFKILTKKEGMGYGDFKLLAAFGAWLGWQALPLIILLSSFVGAFIGIAGILIFGRDKNIPIPFGPYLAIAGLIALFWGDQITQTYLQFANLK
ncbi:MAG: prepilin peptidase [Cellvibrionaceae bacterium]